MLELPGANCTKLNPEPFQVVSLPAAAVQESTWLQVEPLSLDFQSPDLLEP